MQGVGACEHPPLLCGADGCYLLSPFFPRSALFETPAPGFLALAARLPGVMAELGCIPSLRAAAIRPRIWDSLAPVRSKD